MAERSEAEAAETGPAMDPSVAAIAAGLDQAREDPSLRDEVAAFFRAQRTLIEAQTHHLHVQLNDLRLKTAGDLVKLALQGVTLVAVLALAVTVGLTLRDAINDNGLVIDSFSAPPGLAQRGLTGQALAEDMIGRIGAIRRVANANSITVSDDVRAGGADTLKVEIPETGLSLDDVQRFLHASLGHARRLSGEISQGQDGRISIDLHLTQADPIHVEGPAADLDQLMQQAADKAFAAFDPINHVLYLRASERNDEGLAEAERNVQREQTPLLLGGALSLAANSDGDRRRALARALMAIETDPQGWSGWYEASNASRDLGHEEARLGYLRRLLTVKTSHQWRNHRSALPWIRKTARLRIDALTADYDRMAVDLRESVASNIEILADRYLARANQAAAVHDCAAARRYFGEAQAAGGLDEGERLNGGLTLANCTGDSGAAIQAAQGLLAADEGRATSPQAVDRNFAAAHLATRARPALALALAEGGQAQAAAAMIAPTPADCYACLRARGVIAQAQGDRAASERWFAEAIRQAPSLAFANLERAQARLARGDADGAIADAAAAHALSPNFADPLEVWGEALAAKGDPRAATARFAQAAAHAPHWGRLQKAWGETLLKLGREGQARDHLRLAAAV